MPIYNYWFITLVIVGAIVFGFIMLKKNNAQFAMLVAEYLLKIPLVGPIIRQSSLARFCRLMSTLTEAGIPIHRAMALARDAVPNIYVREKVQSVLDDVQIGVTINEAMAKQPCGFAAPQGCAAENILAFRHHIAIMTKDVKP